MLRQLKIQLELKQLREQQAVLEEQKANFDRRSAELEAATKEAQSKEDYDVLERSIDTLTEEIRAADTETKMQDNKAKIAAREKELKDIEDKKKETDEKKPKTDQEEKKERGADMNKLQTRRLLETGEYYERAEVKEFYDSFRNLRSVTGSELTVPQIVVNRITDILGDYCTLYPLVDKIQAHGQIRLLVDADTTPATWIEMFASIPTGDVGTINQVEFQGFKVGKATFVDHAILKDSMINLDDYVTKKIARSIALALDKAILKGEGSSSKQPEGILLNLPSDHKVTVKNPKGYADIVKPISIIDTGEDSIGEIIAVMSRKTYYNRILATNSNGQCCGEIA